MKGNFNIILKLFSLLRDILKIRGFSLVYDRIPLKKLKTCLIGQISFFMVSFSLAALTLKVQW